MKVRERESAKESHFMLSRTQLSNHRICVFLFLIFESLLPCGHKSIQICTCVKNIYYKELTNEYPRPTGNGRQFFKHWSSEKYSTYWESWFGWVGICELQKRVYELFLSDLQASPQGKEETQRIHFFTFLYVLS